MTDYDIGLPNISIYTDAHEIIEDKIYSLTSSTGIELGEIGYKEQGAEYLLRDDATYNAWCQKSLEPDYVRGEIVDSNLIIILRDSDTAMRGIALLKVNEEQMELLVLCCAARPASQEYLDKTFARGIDLIRAIQFLGKDLPHGIKLYALEKVIPLYYRFGWRFLFDCQAQERKYIEDAVKTLAKFYKGHRFDRGGIDDDDEELVGLLTAFKGRAKGMSEIIRTGDAKGIDAFNIARDNGFEMLLCRENNPFNIQDDETVEGKAEAAEGSTRKTKHRRRRKRSKTNRKKRATKDPRKRRRKKTKKTKKKQGKKH